MRTVNTRRGLLRALSRLGAAASLGGAVVGVGLAPPHPARAAGADAAGFVQELADGVMAASRDRTRPWEARVRAIDGLVEQGFALDRIAKIALGPHWRAASPAERDEFSALFKAAVVAGHVRRFDEYADRRVRVAGPPAPAGERLFLVGSWVEGGTAPIRLDWRVAEVDGRWQVIDLVVEGVSLLLTYRNEFAAVIERGGGRVSALIAELRGRTARATG